MEELVFIVAANFPIAVRPERILGRRVAQITAGIYPKSSKRAYSVIKWRVMALGTAQFLTLNWKLTCGGDGPNEPVMAQFISGLVQRIGHAVRDGKDQEGNQKWDDCFPVPSRCPAG